MKVKLSRRDFLKVAAGASLSLAACSNAAHIPPTGIMAQTDAAPPTAPSSPALTSTPSSAATGPFTPKLVSTPAPSQASAASGDPPKFAYLPIAKNEKLEAAVIHVHAPGVTSWTPSSSRKYWEIVNQSLVNDMVTYGVTNLTGMPTAAAAWSTLLPGYSAGKKIAIKINCNNNGGIGDTDGQIDAIKEPIIGVIAGLKLMGVLNSDIIIYDAIRAIPDRIYNEIRNNYSGVLFYDLSGSNGRRAAKFDLKTAIHFSQSAPTILLPDFLVDTAVGSAVSYLINMPILKTHNSAGVTLSFKNHYGSIDKPINIHNFSGSFSPVMEIYKDGHIGPKTVLTICDGLFGQINADSKQPTLWNSFSGKVPCSLFFAKDPVAMDCVLCDLLNAEVGIPSYSDNYLKLANQAGLGVYQRGDPWRNTYSLINYRKIEL